MWDMYLNVCDYPLCVEDTLESVCQCISHVTNMYALCKQHKVVLILWLQSCAHNFSGLVWSNFGSECVHLGNTQISDVHVSICM